MKKRDVLSLMVALPWLSSCASRRPMREVPVSQRRFAGIGCVLVVDAVPVAKMEGVEFHDDRGFQRYSSSVQTMRNRSVMSLGGIYVPVQIRVTWRKYPRTEWARNEKLNDRGPIVGEYTLSIGERIPDDLLSDIRSRGGALRLKFRLKPDGVMFGWDIERDSKTARVRDPYGKFFTYEMPGGDFKEADFYNGKVVVKGWYINELGEKVETDY